MSSIPELIALKDRRRAFMELAGWFWTCGVSDRAAIVSGWPFGSEWEYPSPWKLAWPDGSGDSSEDRMMALLAYYCIAGTGPDSRDVVVAFAIIHNAAILAGLDPQVLFARARAIAEPNVAKVIDSFMQMPADEKSMDAFMLKVVRDADGQPTLTISL
jgi:hypothetical protein